jgi:conjugal transfer/entry exclusion protein
MRLHRVAGLVVGGGILVALSTKAALAQSTAPNAQIQAIQTQIDALQNQLQQL